MCGRYALYGPKSRLRERFDADIDELPPEFGPRYNAAPMQMLPIVRQRPTGERVAHLLRWGLVPSWAHDESIAARLINARAETVAQKPSFRAAYKARRCIVPVSGFYEWQPAPGGKHPYFIHAADDDLLGLAGLWERWTMPNGEQLDTFTIVTTTASELVRRLHDRMPVVLSPDDYGLWLDRTTQPQLVDRLLVPPPDELLRMHPVSKAVGNVRNDGPELVQPMDARAD